MPANPKLSKKNRRCVGPHDETKGIRTRRSQYEDRLPPRVDRRGKPISTCGCAHDATSDLLEANAEVATLRLVLGRSAAIGAGTGCGRRTSVCPPIGRPTHG
jgi:hypothetical protein